MTNLASFWRTKNRREREGRGKERRRGRRREERKKERSSSKIKGMELTLGMNSSMDHMDLWFCMIIILPKPRVFARVLS